MDELVRSKKLQFEKSNLFIQIYKQPSGLEYIKIIQNTENDSKSSIKINPNNLYPIIDTLINFKEEIALNQKVINKYLIKEEDKQPIIKTFLKGITLKDMSLQFGYSIEEIKKLLIENEIEVVDGIEMFPNKVKYYKGKKK